MIAELQLLTEIRETRDFSPELWHKMHSLVSSASKSSIRESGSSRFQPGEGPSRGLLRDYEPSDGTF